MWASLSPILRLSRCRPILIHHDFRATATGIARYSSASNDSNNSNDFDYDGYMTRARQKLSSRKPTIIPDNLSPVPSRLLNSLLGHYCPSLFPAPKTYPFQPPLLPQGHHLVYFPPQLPPSQLMPDLTDKTHCPGAPFVRRMWAGGSIFFGDKWEREMRMDARPMVCVEEIGALELKHQHVAGKDKVYVEVQRAYHPLVQGETPSNPKHWCRTPTPVVHEVRDLVFMRQPEEGSEAPDKRVERRPVKGIALWFSPYARTRLLFLINMASYCRPRLHLHTQARRRPPLSLQRPHLQRPSHPLRH